VFSISGKMTTALVVYSAVFMRYSFVPLLPASPVVKFTDVCLQHGCHAKELPSLRQELLTEVEGFELITIGCHFVNECAQLAQGYRYINYWKFVFHTFLLQQLQLTSIATVVVRNHLRRKRRGHPHSPLLVWLLSLSRNNWLFLPGGVGRVEL